MNNLPISATDLIGSITKARTIIKSSSGDHDAFLRLSKGGFFVYGADDTEVEEDSFWAVNPSSFALGYIAWPAQGTGKPLGEEMRSITDDPIAESTLPQVGGQWVQQVAMQLVCLTGEDTGTQVVYKASSKGGINGYNDFLNVVLEHLSANPGDANIVPVITLQSDSYKHQTYGKIFTPVFKLEKWVSMDSMPTADDLGGEDDAPIEEPKVEEKPAPTRRRRRKAAA